MFSCCNLDQGSVLLKGISHMEEAIPEVTLSFSEGMEMLPFLATAVGGELVVVGCCDSPNRLGSHNPKDFFSRRSLRVLHLESVHNFPLSPLKSQGGTGTEKRPSASLEAGELGIEVKLDDYSLEFFLAPECHIPV